MPTGTAAADALEDAVHNPQRTSAFQERDQYRNPLETLRFFGVQADTTVAEIWAIPGWYAEILAPYLKADGKYYAVGFSLSAKRTPQYGEGIDREVCNQSRKLLCCLSHLAFGAGRYHYRTPGHGRYRTYFPQCS